MTVLKRRSHLVYFRVSEDEFENYTKLCQTAGARSVSDLARSAVNRMLVASEAAPSQAMMAAEIARLTKQLETLTKLLRTERDERRPYKSTAHHEGKPGRD